MRKTRIIKAVLVIVLVLSVGAGIARKEIWDVISNATLLCYSCIGIK